MQVLQAKILDPNELVSEMCKLLRRLVPEDIAFNFHAGKSLGRVRRVKWEIWLNASRAPHTATANV
jgi:hypothetical protein